MEKTIFIGGNRGIGKTKLSLDLKEIFGISYIQYSEYNIKMAIDRFGELDWSKLSEPENASWINNEFIDHIKKIRRNDGSIIIDGHYSYYDSPPFEKEEYNRLLEHSDSLSVLVFASLPSTIARIKQDRRDRFLDQAKIEQDIDWNRKMFDYYTNNTGTERFILENEEFQTARSQLTNRIRKFLFA